MATSILNQICAHLEFLGYTITPGEKTTTATHPKKLNIILRDFNDGVLFTGIFTCNDLAKKDRVGYLNFINSLNQKAAIARFYADKDSDLFYEAWFPNNYDRANFGRFAELWDQDTLGELLAAPDARKYLG
ncbi:MAG: hypothetical protein ONB44_03520 [candidate division KSB1 bacterium]|nr:hypothetical protein [candidate division KSB1 bacterium]MDZ7301197.1 hypothetical protein [candidate division KSB1 bacterium]MDZ7310579.1 hypothetical protein [candidate division KSB1 bacterium]